MRILFFVSLFSCTTSAPSASPTHQQRVGSPASQRITPLSPALTLTQFGRSIASGDFNGDGTPEVAVGALDASDHGVITLWDASGGPAALSATLPAYAPPNPAEVYRWGDDGASLAVTDINGDGFDDLIAGDPSFMYTDDTLGGYGPLPRGRLLIYLGGAGGLTGPTEMIGEWAGEHLGESLLALGDVDADGFGDLFANHDGNNWELNGDVLSVLHGLSTGGFRKETAMTPYVPGGGFFVLWPDQVGHSVAALGDVDGDGADDMVWSFDEREATAPVSTRLQWSRGAADVVFDGREGWVLEQASSFATMRDLTGPGDINGDGLVDLVVGADNASYTASWYAGTGAGFGTAPAGWLRFEASDVPVVSYNGTRGRVIAAGDVDGDGVGDLVALATNETELLVYRWSSGAGGPTEDPTDVRGLLRTDVGETLILHPAGDLDGDGIADLVHSDGDGKVTILWGDGPANCVPGGFAQIWYLDDDGDGFASSSHTRLACTAPAGAMLAPGGDCDDDNATVSPAGVDVVNLDGNCDGQVLCFTDADDDGWGASPAHLVPGHTCGGHWAPMAVQGGDCDDDARGTHPQATERTNGVDSNCDGSVSCYEDLDDDGWGGIGQVAVVVAPGASGACGANLATRTNDCDDADPLATTGNASWYPDLDDDGYGDRYGTPVFGCHMPQGYRAEADDCDDARAWANPLGTEQPGGGDEDCDYNALCYVDADDDGWGATATASIHTSTNARDCAALPQAADLPTDCDDATAATHPGQHEDLSTPTDDNCNGATRPTLTASISPGRTLTVTLVDAPPARPTALFGSRVGTGPGICPAPLRGPCLGILQAQVVGAARITDGLGEAVFAIPSLPAVLSGSTIWLQTATTAAAGRGGVSAPVSVVVP